MNYHQLCDILTNKGKPAVGEIVKAFWISFFNSASLPFTFICLYKGLSQKEAAPKLWTNNDGDVPCKTPVIHHSHGPCHGDQQGCARSDPCVPLSHILSPRSLIPFPLHNPLYHRVPTDTSSTYSVGWSAFSCSEPKSHKC